MPSMHDYMVASRAMEANYRITPLAPDIISREYQVIKKRTYEGKLDPVRDVVNRLRDLNPTSPDKQYTMPKTAIRLLHNPGDYLHRN